MTGLIVCTLVLFACCACGIAMNIILLIILRNIEHSNSTTKRR